ncbi:hypothetical protein [Pelagibius sp.]|uniref:hypothetical protein n=1 Tax=Pelagibius sp. TaxID=1931238 RepID=UPI002607533C|nr:hypothetical protein [Pelagibius sp.]
MNPTSGDVHVNRPLTNMSVANWQSDDNFVADRVFPILPVEHKSDVYYIFNRGDLARDEMKIRAPRSESAGSGYRVQADDPYLCRVRALHTDIDDETRGNTDSPLNNDRAAVNFLNQKARINRENRFITSYMALTVWSGEVTGVAAAPGAGQVLKWSDPNSTPIQDIRTAKTAVHVQSGGFMPNTLVIAQDVEDQLVDHPDIVDRVKYGTQDGVSTVDLSELAALLKLDRIMTMRGVVNAAKEGAADPSMALLGSGKALLAYVPPNPAIETPAAGYTFVWRNYPGSGAQGQRIKTFRVDTKNSDRYEIETADDQKRVSADCGHYFHDII